MASDMNADTEQVTSSASTTMAQKLALVGGTVVLGIGLAACGGSSDSSTTPTNQVSSEASSSGIDLATGNLPNGWPSDVPSPPNTTVEGGGGSNGNFSAGFKGTGSLESELDAYSDELKSNGWTQDTRVNTGKNLTGWNKDNRRIQVIAQDNGDGSYLISVTVINKKS